MRKLYFDLDGTILDLSTGLPKAALAHGRLEAAIRRARVDELVCVGNFVGLVHAMETLRPGYDGLGGLFALCDNAFDDEGWFRERVRLAADPKFRAVEVDLSADGWYMDDEGERYFAYAGLIGIWQEHLGKRILRPLPRGDGEDVLTWMAWLAGQSPGPSDGPVPTGDPADPSGSARHE